MLKNHFSLNATINLWITLPYTMFLPSLLLGMYILKHISNFSEIFYIGVEQKLWWMQTNLNFYIFNFDYKPLEFIFFNLISQIFFIIKSNLFNHLKMQKPCLTLFNSVKVLLQKRLRFWAKVSLTKINLITFWTCVYYYIDVLFM